MPADEAIILVGGMGTRLRQVVSDVPKPLAPIGGRPFLALVLDHLAESGIRRIILAAGYMAEQVRGAVGSEWAGMEVVMSVEESPLGTGGAIRRAAGRLKGSAAHVINGDTFLRYAPMKLEQATRQARASIGIALARAPDVVRYGAVVWSDDKVVKFQEKGCQGQGWINAGCYFLTSEAIAALPEGTGGGAGYSFETEVLIPMVKQGRVAAYTDTGGFIDIGVPDDYSRAQARFGGPR